MVIKTPFYSWNKCSIFFRLTINGSKKRFKTIFYGNKKFQKNAKFKNNTIFGKGSIFASDYQKKSLFFKIYFKFFISFTDTPITNYHTEKKMRFFSYLLLPYFLSD